MSKAEESYKYALNSEKYDSEVKESVGKKVLSKKDANTVNNIQEMMRKEKEEQRNKKSRQVVTSENRAEFMAKKLNLANKEKEVRKKDKPHGIWKSKSDELHSHYPSEEKAYEAYQNLGQKMADHAMGELSQSECKECGYK